MNPKSEDLPATACPRSLAQDERWRDPAVLPLHSRIGLPPAGSMGMFHNAVGPAMRRSWVLVFLLLCSSAVAQLRWEPAGSYSTLIGRVPLWIAFGPSESDTSPQSTAYILSAGVDANFNGVEDSADVPPGLDLIRVHSMGVEQLGLSLPWGPFSFPLRPVVGWIVQGQGVNFYAYLPRPDRVALYQLPIPGEPERLIYPAGAAAVALHGDTIVLSRRVSESVGHLVRLSLRGEPLDTLVVFGCRNIQQVLYDAARQQYIVLCEGTFGQNNSVVQFLRPGEARIVPVGGTGNFLLLSGDTLLVVANGSHELYLLDAGTGLWLSRLPISVGTSGFGGPREAVLLYLPNGQATALVSTYSRDVRWIDLASGEVLQILPTQGLAEGMALRRLRDTLELWVVQPFTPAYAPESTVTVYRLPLPVSVEEPAMALQQPQLFPMPVSEGPVLLRWRVPELAGVSAAVELFSGDGRCWARWTVPCREGMVEALLPISRRLLPAGVYSVRVRVGAHTAHVPVVVY
jgi:hypothetical protein